jgi:hypothetical protein
MRIKLRPARNPNPASPPNQIKMDALTKVVVKSARDALYAKHQLENPPEEINPHFYSSLRRVFTRAFLNHAALCSRVLWPAKKDKRDQNIAAEIRACLGIADDSPINSRDVRNSFEHIDERLERWAESGEGSEPMMDNYLIGVEMEMAPEIARRHFSAYLNGVIVTPGLKGDPEEVNTQVVGEALEALVEAGTAHGFD